MILTLSTTTPPATDLGYLLAKNPARAHRFALAFGAAHIFYPEAAEDRCTAALLLDIDPVRLVRGSGGAGGPLEQYVNDRPFVASSFLSVAIAEVFGSALNGRSRERPELAAAAIPLEATLTALPARGGPAAIRSLFEPLGYTVELAGHPLDPRFPEWGESPYYRLTLRHTCRLSELLTHLYVLVPVLDAEKHYYIGDAEVEKLLRRGEGWLAAHPERERIAARYLRRRGLIRAALARLADDPLPEGDDPAEADPAAEERRRSLHSQRIDAVVETLRELGAASVLDLGCGEGRLLAALLPDRRFTRLLGLDVSFSAIERARERLRLDRLPESRRGQVSLIQGALTYRDARLRGFDAAALVEVIEHLDPPRLAALERSLFGDARPTSVLITTPNREYNALFPGLPPGALRHRDHRFEWDRAELAAWAGRVAETYGYSAVVRPIGPEDAAHGAPSQLAVFRRQG